MARDILRQNALKPFVLTERQPGPEISDERPLLEYAMRAYNTDYHSTGARRVAANPMAVVRPDLKLHTLDGIRICDASIMPRINSSNTNAPTIMIGEKRADLIKGTSPLPSANLPRRPRSSA